MTALRFDHFITFTNAASIDEYRTGYAAQGFAAADTTVRHEPGLRNGFVRFGPEYLEFAWVEDEALFDAADATERLLRAAHRPHGIGFVADDIDALHADWLARGRAVSPVWSKAARDAAPDAPPAWSFMEIPAECLPGAACFAVTYHARSKHGVRKVQVPPNGIYAVTGPIFVTAEPEGRAAAWRDVLAPDEPVIRTEGGAAIAVGPHRAEWMTPTAYRARLGFPWTPAPHAFGELSALRLVATDLDRARRMLEDAGRDVRSSTVEGSAQLLVMPDARDGFAFAIEAMPSETWRTRRTARTGEALRLVDA